MSIIYSLLSVYALTTVWCQQSNTTAPSTAPANSTDVPPSALEQCATQKGCSLTDLNCRALCSGVPNPTASQVNATNNCVASCNQTDIPAYILCTQNCINNNYNQISANSSSSSSSSGGKNATGKGSNSSSSGTSSSAHQGSPVYFSSVLVGSVLFAAISAL